LIDFANGKVVRKTWVDERDPQALPPWSLWEWLGW
jgi:hypothetical protein